MCMSSGGECRVLVEVVASYTLEEEQQLIASTTSALEAIDRFTGGRAADIFTGLAHKDWRRRCRERRKSSRRRKSGVAQ